MSCQNKKRLWKELMLRKPEIQPDNLFWEVQQKAASNMEETIDQEQIFVHEVCDHDDEKQSSAPKFYIPSLSDQYLDIHQLQAFDTMKIRKRSSEKFILENDNQCVLRSSQKIPASNLNKNYTTIESLMSFGYEKSTVIEDELRKKAKNMKSHVEQFKTLILYINQSIRAYRNDFFKMFQGKNQFGKMINCITEKLNDANNQIKRLKQVISEKQLTISTKEKQLEKQIALKSNYLELLNKQWKKNLEFEEKLLQSSQNRKRHASEYSKFNKTVGSTNLRQQSKIDNPKALEVPKIHLKTWSGQQDDDQKIQINKFQSLQQYNFTKKKNYILSKSKEKSEQEQKYTKSPTLRSQKQNSIQKNLHTNSPVQIKSKSPLAEKSKPANSGKRYRRLSVHESIGDIWDSQKLNKQEQFKNMSIRLQKMNNELKQQIAKYSKHF